MQKPIHIRPPVAWIVLGVVLVWLLGSIVVDTLALHAEPEVYRLTQSVIGSSGDIHVSPRYQLAGTSGQVTGPISQSSPRFRLSSGFWGATDFLPDPHVYDRSFYLPTILRRSD